MRIQLPLLFHLAGRFGVFVVIFAGTTVQSVLWLSDIKGLSWFTQKEDASGGCILQAVSAGLLSSITAPFTHTVKGK